MRILKVWDSEYPWDVRTEKVCQALTGAGHEVHMVARNRRGDAVRETLDECVVHRLRPWARAGRRLDAASQFPAFLNPRWIRHIHKTGADVRADLILVRDIPLAPAAIRAGRRLGVPVMLDMAENYPAMIRDLWTTGATRFGDFLVRNPRAVEMVERWVLARIDHTVVVVEESRDRLVSLGVPADRVSVVSNTPSLSRIEEFEGVCRDARARRDGAGNGGTDRRLSLVYLGLLEEARGVGVVIEAMAAARKAGVAATLDLIGDGRALPAFRQRARELGLSDQVIRFHGFVPYSEALARVAAADAGLIPHFANESWQTTIPNKLFDYMSLGLPVIASDVIPVARVLGETGAGVTFEDRNVADLAAVLESLQDPASREAMGRAGSHAVRTHYHWEQDARRLEEALHRTTTRNTNRG